MAARKLSLDDQLCFALYAATNAITRSYRPGLDLLGITYPQYLLLLCLWQDGPSTTGAIARRLALAPNAITPLVDRLERGGFVERHRDEGDRRVVHVRLTTSGRELESHVAELQHDVACRTGLEPEALDALRAELKALVCRMEARPEAANDLEPDKRQHTSN